MSDWIIYGIGGLAVLVMLGRPAVMLCFPDSALAQWLDEHGFDGFGSGSDSDGCGGDGGD